MPTLLPLLIQRFVPEALQLTRDTPSQLLVPQMHPNQVSLMDIVINKLVSPMQQRKIVDEVYVARLEGNFEAIILGYGIYKV